jgi:hypothetical protein
MEAAQHSARAALHHPQVPQLRVALDGGVQQVGQLRQQQVAHLRDKEGLELNHNRPVLHRVQLCETLLLALH